MTYHLHSTSFVGSMNLIFGLSVVVVRGTVVTAFEAADFLVTGLEKIEPAFAEFDGKMYAGVLPMDVELDEKRGELMFWQFQPNKGEGLNTVTIWLNGGPGCSSLKAGVLFECAPVTSPHFPAGYPKTSYDEPLIFNEWAWTKATNMLFVEQPGGIGFSTGPEPHTEADLAQDFYNFLRNFYATFPHMKKKDLFIFGESYAGYYVPSIAHKIHIENKKKEHEFMSLRGLGIGNGWMDAWVQGPAVIDYAWWHGMIDSTTRDGLHSMWEDCKAGLPMDPPFHEFTVPDECNFMGATMAASGAGIFPDRHPNVYDVTTWDTYPILSHPNSTYMRFYNNPQVKEALHAPMDIAWVGCIPGAGRRLEEELPGKTLLAHDKPESVVPYLAELLDDGIRVLMYNGDRDISVNAVGSEMLLDEMKWSGSGEWRTAPRALWMVEDKVAGYAKAHASLDFVIVYNSGHLVPNNVPIPALDLITRMVTGASYLDIALPIFPRKNKEIAKPRETTGSSHTILVVLVALVCYSFGLLTASWWRRKSQYSRIPGVANGDETGISIHDSSR